MAKFEKVAITLDEDLLRASEALRRRTRESRSGLISRALRRLLAEEERQKAVQRYIEAYREHPESADDVAEAERFAAAALSAVPWERGRK